MGRARVPTGRVTLPLLMAAAGGAVKVYDRSPGWAVALAALAGAALGALLYLLRASLSSSIEGRREPTDRRARAARLPELEAEKRRLLRAIKDLDFDADLGRLARADRDRLVMPLKEAAARVLREIDEIRAGAQPPPPDEAIAREVARRAARPSTATEARS